MRTVRYLLGAMCCLLLTGCAAGTTFQPVQERDPNQALIYIYRPFNNYGWVWSVRVLIDETERGELASNGYLALYVKPGMRVVETKDGHPAMRMYLETVAGKEYYIRYGIKQELWNAIYTLGVVPEEIGLEEIRKTKNCVKGDNL